MNFFIKYIFKNEFTIALFAAVLFIPFIGSVNLFDWDEINFAESAREMIVTGDFFSVQINYERFYEKPPLFFWFQVLSMKVFGINEFAARFPNAVCGIITLVVLFRVGKKEFDINLGRTWVLVYLGTFFTFLYFKSGIIDPWFNLFIFLAIYNLYVLTSKDKTGRMLYAFYAGLFLGLAVLTKGPTAIVITGLVYLMYLLLNRFKFNIKLNEFAIIFMTTIGVSFLWFGIDLLRNGPQFLDNFIQYHIRLLRTGEAGHDQPFFYHWWVLLLGCFPASIFFIQGMYTKTQTGQQYAFKKWMLILFWVTLLLFSIVKTKIIHYSSLCWFPLTFLAALCIYELSGSGKKLHKLLKWLFLIIGFSLSVMLIAIPVILSNKDKWIDQVKDVFARENLKADIQWAWYDATAGLVLLCGIIAYLTLKNQSGRIGSLFLSVTICCLFIGVFLVPKIEGISQRANIDFFKSLKKENGYFATVNYKSYGLYYYTQKLPDTNKEAANFNWLMHGKIDKPVYISAKIQSKPMLDTMPGLKLLYEKNGYIFYKRSPVIE